jgi:hypothetical protein
MSHVIPFRRVEAHRPEKKRRRGSKAFDTQMRLLIIDERAQRLAIAAAGLLQDAVSTRKLCREIWERQGYAPLREHDWETTDDAPEPPAA